MKYRSQDNSGVKLEIAKKRLNLIGAGAIACVFSKIDISNYIKNYGNVIADGIVIYTINFITYLFIAIGIMILSNKIFNPQYINIKDTKMQIKIGITTIETHISEFESIEVDKNKVEDIKYWNKVNDPVFIKISIANNDSRMFIVNRTELKKLLTIDGANSVYNGIN